MRWLQKLGTRARLLRRLEVDVDVDIFFSSKKSLDWIPMADELLDLWPLLEFLWRNDLRLDLSVLGAARARSKMVLTIRPQERIVLSVSILIDLR